MTPFFKRCCSNSLFGHLWRTFRQQLIHDIAQVSLLVRR